MVRSLVFLLFFIVFSGHLQEIIKDEDFVPKIRFMKEDLLNRLTDLEFKVTQGRESEYPREGKFENFFEAGKYNCIVCNEYLFSSEDKFQNKGFASFWKADGNIVDIYDWFYGMERIEARCGNCGSYMGHAYDNKIRIGERKYFMNSCALNFEPVNYELVKNVFKE